MVNSTKNIKTVVVHNGIFHADDVFAVAILELVLGKIKLIRTRDEKKLSQADIRVDVGNKNNPKTNDFDHHQIGGAGTRDNGIPYAACGLVWKHYGKRLCGTIDAALHVDEKLIQPLDATDNGVRIFTNPRAHPYTISTLIKSINPSWHEKDEDYDSAFKRAVKLAKIILGREIILAEGIKKADTHVRNAISLAKKKSVKYLILDPYCPWERIVLEESDALYVVFPSATGDWRVKCVPVRGEDDFENRKSLPEKWAGLEFEELAKVTGVKDAVFCHRSRFIAGAKSKNGTIKLTELAISN